MKILFDQNISFRIIKIISEYFPEAAQIRFVGHENSSDIEIWEYAKNNGYSIVTFDSDFIDITNLKGFPPKIIWLRIGNTSTEEIATILIENRSRIKEFLENQELAFLEID